jgi:hypothetical protein
VQRLTNQFAHGEADTKTAETAVCHTLVTLAKGRHSQVNPEPDTGINPVLNLEDTITQKTTSSQDRPDRFARLQ